MSRYVALLRGINLGSRNRVSMGDLRQLFAGLGHTDVTTYVQSGNVVFKPAHEDADEVRAEIEERIARELGLDVTVLVRREEELTRIVAANPFVDRGADPSALHMTFLAGDPDPERAKRLDRSAGAPDEFVIDGSEIYLHCPDGYGRSKLSNAFFEKQLGVAATTRNWRTVTTLQELANG